MGALAQAIALRAFGTAFSRRFSQLTRVGLGKVWTSSLSNYLHPNYNSPQDC
jgi:hypothetical protein